MVKRVKDVKVDADVLVIGGGISGLWAGIRAKDFAENVTIVDKAKVSKSGSSSYLAGVLFICFPGEDKEVWFKEVVQGGEYLNDQEWAKILVEGMYPRAMEMDGWAAKYRRQVFEKDDKGDFVRRRTRGHINTKISVVNAQPYMEVLRKAAEDKGVRILERIMVNDLVVKDGRAVGAIGFNYWTGEMYRFRAKALVLCPGPASFKANFMGHKNLTGEGVAAGYRAGAILKNMEQVANNTCAAGYDTHGMNLMVGIGGEFVNNLGEKFMWKYNPVVGPRASLHELGLAFCREVMEGRGPIYLDATGASAKDRELCRKILPETFKVYDEVGYSPLDKPMKWVPATYGYVGSGGGIDIDAKARTNLVGLFASGDTAWRASAGAGGGPGGKAAGFAIVSGYVAGESAGEHAKEGELIDWRQPGLREQANDLEVSFVQPLLAREGICADEVILRLQKLMFRCDVLFIRSEKRLAQTLEQILDIRDNMLPKLKAVDYHDLVKANEAKNLVLNAEALFRFALVRKESRGIHFLEEYPRTDNVNWLKHVLGKLENGQMKLWTEGVATPYIRPAEDYSIPPGVRRE